MQPENIAILGDSWAWGEWSFVGETNFPTHSGTHHYLQQEYPRATSHAIYYNKNISREV